MPQSSLNRASILISSLGWVIAVIVVAVSLFIVKPYYFGTGYDQGKSDQYNHDVTVVQNYIGSPPPPTANLIAVPIQGKITAVSSNSLQVDSLAPASVNPLINQPRKYTILVDAQTKIYLQSPKTQAEYQDAVKKAQAANQDPSRIMPYDQKVIAISDLKVGDTIQALGKDPTDSTKETFTASEIDMNAPNSDQQPGR